MHSRIILFYRWKGNVIADNVKYLDIKEVENILAQPKQNITFIKGGYDDISHLEYTYSSAGRDFKVVEYTNDDYTVVDSTIYIKTMDMLINVKNGLAK